MLNLFFGNKLKIINSLKKEIKKLKLEEFDKIKLESIISSYYCDQQGDLLKNNFKLLLQLSDSDIFNIIYQLFGSKLQGHDIFEKENIEYFYYSFITDNPKIKAILASYFIFENNDKIKYQQIILNINKFFQRDRFIFENLLKLYNDFISFPSNNKTINKDDLFLSRKDFFTKMRAKPELYNFKCIKQIRGSNEIINLADYKNSLDFVCDCGNLSHNEDNFDSMKRAYDSLISKTGNLFYLEEFAKILKKNSIHQNFINLIIDYLQKTTQKDFFCFVDLKNLFLNLDYSLNLEVKKKFIFKMLLTIYDQENGLTLEQIEKYLNCDDNSENNNTIITQDTYGEEEFLKENNTIDEMIKSIKPHLENFGLLPYLLFKAKADNKKVKRKLIQKILKNDGIDNCEQYLKNNFDSSDDFYAVSTKFWNLLMDENEEAPEFINNSDIAEYSDLIKEEDILQEKIVQMQRENAIKQEKEKPKKPDNNKKKKQDNKQKVENQDKEKEKGNEIKEGENKNNEENKDKQKDNANETQFVTKLANLKRGKKYGIDFFILCGELYKLIKNNYRFDYIIKFRKFQTTIKLKSKIDNNKKEEAKEEKKEGKNEEVKEERNEEKKEEKKVEQKEEEKEGKNGEEKEDKKEEERKEEKKEEEKDEEYIKNEKLVNENLNKFIIDVDKGLISKIKEGNAGYYILKEIDFYPIRAYVQSYGNMVRLIERAKTMYKNLNEEISILSKPKNEQDRIYAEKKKKKELLRKRRDKYEELMNDLHGRRMWREINDEEFAMKYSQLQEKYKDVLEKPEKSGSDYVTDITMQEFLDTLKQYRNSLLIEKQNGLTYYQRHRTFKEISKELLKLNPNLKKRKLDFYYYLFSSQTLFIPDDNYEFEKEGKDSDDFICIIIDIYGDKGENFNQLLTDKEKGTKTNEGESEKQTEKKKEEPKKEKKKEKTEKKNEEKNNKEKEEKKKLTKEEIEKQKAEKKRLEKEKKQREKEEKEKQKKLYEEYEKQMREQEKKMALEEKERKRLEKELKEKQKKLQKEQELERERQKEREKFISPPYGINNYGNTCYFNSINQIFFNLPILQQIFLDPKIGCYVNKTNKFGHQGKFFEIYKELYWIKPSKIGDTVINLKKMVGKFKEDFNNTDQQDANEYLNFVLENLHEELNLHSTKIYIENKDDIFHHNTDEELGNIYWANNLKRNTSFIDSIFMFQLKSNLKCKKCKQTKKNFETNYIFDLPLSLCRMVTVEIYLYRLPFIYKLYYDKINKDFESFIQKEENKNTNIFQNLWKFYTNVLSNEQKKQHVIKLHFSFDLEREKKMTDITKILRGIKPLELEPENITEVYTDKNLIEYKVNQLTDLITYSKEKGKIIYPDSSIDKYVNIEDKIIINVYEILNTNGMQLLCNKENSDDDVILNLYTYLLKTNQNLKKFTDILKDTNYSLGNSGKSNINIKGNQEKNEIITENKIIDHKKETNIISLKEQMIYYPKDIINPEKNNIKTEFAIPIFHYYRNSKQSQYLFRDFVHDKISQFPVQYIILNNSYNITPKQLYDYVWNLNTLYMNHPNIETNKFWWNQAESKTDESKEETSTPISKNNNNKENIHAKKCYPFVLRYCEIPSDNNEEYKSNLLHCPICPWYSFCPGCIIDPKEKKLLKLASNLGIVVDWCINFINDEFITANFKFSNNIDYQVISENLPILDKNQTYQSLKDCFDLFFVEENLEDPLYCHNCQGPEDFTKRYSINKLPYVLILSLKRFKFNQNSNFKLRQMITYPLYDLKLEDKSYDLYGVVNHYGSISSGHYTAIIKKDGKDWYMCDDSRVYKIEENRVMHSNAYILFYICKESPYKNDYIRFMKSTMNNIILKGEKDKKEAVFKKDKNFFRGEPVITKYGEGYVVEDNLVDFEVDEKYNIYDKLKKEDDLRVENIIKKDKENDKKNKKDKKEEKIEDKKEQKADDKKDNKDKAENKKEEIKEDKIIENEKNSENKNVNDKSNENNNKNEENKKEESKTEEKNKNEENKKEENKNEENKNEENKNEENKNEENKNEENKNEENKSEENKNEENKNEENKNEENKNEENKNEENKNEENKDEQEKGSIIKDEEKKDKNEQNNLNKEDEEKVDNKNIIKEGENNKEKNQEEVKEGKTDEAENKINKINDNESTNQTVNNESLNQINEIKTNNKEEESQNKIILSEEKDKKSLPEYYNNFVRVKFDYGEGWILKSKVKKYNGLKIEENDNKKNKKK